MTLRWPYAHRIFYELVAWEMSIFELFMDSLSHNIQFPPLKTHGAPSIYVSAKGLTRFSL